MDSNENGCQVQLLVQQHNNLCDLIINDAYRPNGTKFLVEHESITTQETPEEGDVVTVDYEQFSRRDLPIEPRIIRIRTDLEWRDVLRDYASGDSSLGMLFFL